MESNVKKVNTENFEQTVLKSEKPFLLDFGAEWCGPCRSIEQAFEALASQYEEVNFGKLDTDESSEIAMQYQVSSIPTIILFKAGEEANRVIGANIPSITNMIKEV